MTNLEDFFFHGYFSRFHKINTKAYINNLRHCSLHMNILYRYVNCYAWETNIRRDILVQKLKVKISIFLVPDPLILLHLYEFSYNS